MKPTPYAELHTHSTYSYLHGTDTPWELIKTAQKLQLTGIAITDYNGFPAAIQTNQAAKTTPIPTIYGTEITLNHPQQGPPPHRPPKPRPQNSPAHARGINRNFCRSHWN